MQAPRDIGSIIRGRRIQQGLSQVRLAALAGVSRKWVYEFEAGKPAAQLSQLLRVLATLDLRFDVTPIELADIRGEESDSIDLDDHLDRYLRRRLSTDSAR